MMEVTSVSSRSCVCSAVDSLDIGFERFSRGGRVISHPANLVSCHLAHPALCPRQSERSVALFPPGRTPSLFRLDYADRP